MCLLFCGDFYPSSVSDAVSSNSEGALTRACTDQDHGLNDAFCSADVNSSPCHELEQGDDSFPLLETEGIRDDNIT